MTILAPIAVIAGFVTGFAWVSFAVAVGVVVMAYVLKWIPVREESS